MSTGVIRQPLLQIDSLDPGWQRDLCSHSLPSRAKGMWKIVQHRLKLLPGRDISVLLTFHWPKQVIQSHLTLNWEGTNLSLLGRRREKNIWGVALMIVPGNMLSSWFMSPSLQLHDGGTVLVSFYNMRNQGLMICKWSNRIHNQICWIPLFVLITKRLFCFLKYSELTFIELRDYRGTKSKCFVHFISFHPHSFVK